MVDWGCIALAANAVSGVFKEPQKFGSVYAPKSMGILRLWDLGKAIL